MSNSSRRMRDRRAMNSPDHKRRWAGYLPGAYMDPLELQKFGARRRRSKQTHPGKR